LGEKFEQQKHAFRFCNLYDNNQETGIIHMAKQNATHLSQQVQKLRHKFFSTSFRKTLHRSTAKLRGNQFICICCMLS